MGITKQFLMAEQDQKQYLEFFKALVESGAVDEEGELGKQLAEVVEQEDPSIVMDEVPEELQSFLDCARCANTIPPSELVASLDNGGNCGYCDHMENKDD
jgi:hypothetical protein